MKHKFKISVILSTIILLFATPARAQISIGVETGPVYNYLITNTDKDPHFSYESRVGYSFGIPVRYQIPSLSKWKWFGGFILSPTYVTKNYSTTRIGYSDNHVNYRNSHIDIPLMANFQWGDLLKRNPNSSFHVIANVGVFASFWVSGHMKGVVADENGSSPYYTKDIDKKLIFDDNKEQRFQGGTVFGLGIKYSNDQKTFFTVEGRLSSSRRPMFKNKETNYPAYHDTYGLMVGIQTSWQNIFK